jgi:DNA-binding response OmpR family regulator
VQRILLVDDDDQVRRILRKRLEKSGFEVLEAADGETALHLYRQSPTDAVITDLVMPGKGGQGLITDLRVENPTVRIVAISGAIDQDVPALLAEAEGRGALRTLAKPFTSEQLLEAVGEVLGGEAGASRHVPRARAIEGWLDRDSAIRGMAWGTVLLLASLVLGGLALLLALLGLVT